MLADLDSIRAKIRRLTRSPSEAQITTPQIDDYINIFISYDFPEHIRLFSLRTKLTFFTSPYVDSYGNNVDNEHDPLYNFKNIYTGIYPPVYIDGYNINLCMSENEFYGLYPKINHVASIGTTGNGVLTNFTGTLSTKPILQGMVTFTSIDANNQACTLIDDPETDADGRPLQTGLIIEPNDTTVVLGAINYVTGGYDITFATAPANGAAIYSHTFPYSPSRPNLMLYYGNTFVMRPVPDKAYRVTVEAQIRPTALLAGAAIPELEQWSQYIAYGASKKIFEDRMDMESVQMITPEFKEQERLCLRRTIVQQSSERVKTIYSNQTDSNYTWNNSGNYY